MKQVDNNFLRKGLFWEMAENIRVQKRKRKIYIGLILIKNNPAYPELSGSTMNDTINVTSIVTDDIKNRCLNCNFISTNYSLLYTNL
ncbi:MAG: hypothetical protein DI598_15885 [Pseudopedobacter saltans]|uniref:Uncharacterized protein n=1 Tax=Pseudopedobacter saltans TaxID=151895 RepID=A0A2W5GMS0_9SPHI|nr:MAG: hypothetical protein DI598_15885 [Pseudopedobacter saltans]